MRFFQFATLSLATASAVQLPFLRRGLADSSCITDDVAATTVALMSNGELQGCNQEAGEPNLASLLQAYDYTCDDQEAILEVLVENGLISEDEASQFDAYGNVLWMLCCETCHDIADGGDSSKTTAPSKSGTDTCMSDVVMPCMQANDLTLMTMSSKDCLAAAMSGISVCANEACFKTMYDFCQSLA